MTLWFKVLHIFLLIYRKEHTSRVIQEEDLDGIYCDIAGRHLDRRQNVPQPNLATRALVPTVPQAMQSIENLHNGSTDTINSMPCDEPEMCDSSDSDELEIPMWV